MKKAKQKNHKGHKYVTIIIAQINEIYQFSYVNMIDHLTVLKYINYHTSVLCWQWGALKSQFFCSRDHSKANTAKTVVILTEV